MTTPATYPDEFFSFLASEGLLGEATIASGTDRAAHLQAMLAAGKLRQQDVDAALARFRARAAASTVAGPGARPVTDLGSTVVGAGAAPGASSAADPLIGTTLGGCRLEKLLGQGGMGAVYLATQVSLDRRVAVKVQKEMAIPELVDRFRTEAKTLGRLHSPHIVDVYEVGTENGIPWFVMEYMPGGSLTGFARQQPDGKLARVDAARLLLESCLGLAEAERHGVLHRDIKPDNLLLDGNGALKIADFGIAKIVQEDPGLTATGFSPGTPAFKSPEQHAARPLDFRTDMYSLGVSFWTLITGQRPRDVVTRQEALEGARNLAWSSPELAEVNGDPLLEVICRMMALKREDRFASWQQLIDVLRALPAGSGTAPPRSKAGRTAGARIAVAAVLVVVLGVGAWWALTRPPAAIELSASGSPTAQPAERRDGSSATASNERREGGSAKPSDQRRDGSAATPSNERPDPAATTPPAANEPQRDRATPDDARTATTSTPPPPADTNSAPPTDAPQQPPQQAQSPQNAPSSAAAEPDTAARAAFLAQLALPSPATPRSADDVRTDASNLDATARGFRLSDDARYTAAKQRLERELAAAVVRDELLAIRSLTAFDQLAQLRQRAGAIELEPYRASATAHVDQLERDRPRFLRLSAADQQWLAAFATWPLTDADTVDVNGRLLPATIRDTRRADARMVLLWSADLLPVYVDATEVTLRQWTTSNELPPGLDGAADAEQPVRNVDRAAIDKFLAAHSLRLPTVAEFAFALDTRAGDRWWWGNTAEPPPGYPRINVADKARRQLIATAPYLTDHDDGVAGIAAAADPRFVQGRAGQFVHLLGNVAEWVTDNSAAVVIGGSFTTSSWTTFECRHRQTVLGDQKRQDLGFRAARRVPVR